MRAHGGPSHRRPLGSVMRPLWGRPRVTSSTSEWTSSGWHAGTADPSAADPGAGTPPSTPWAADLALVAVPSGGLGSQPVADDALPSWVEMAAEEQAARSRAQAERRQEEVRTKAAAAPRPPPAWPPAVPAMQAMPAIREHRYADDGPAPPPPPPPPAPRSRGRSNSRARPGQEPWRQARGPLRAALGGACGGGGMRGGKGGGGRGAGGGMGDRYIPIGKGGGRGPHIPGALFAEKEAALQRAWRHSHLPDLQQ